VDLQGAADIKLAFRTSNCRAEVGAAGREGICLGFRCVASRDIESEEQSRNSVKSHKDSMKASNSGSEFA
jgi:hypothetical protein